MHGHKPTDYSDSSAIHQDLMKSPKMGSRETINDYKKRASKYLKDQYGFDVGDDIDDCPHLLEKAIFYSGFGSESLDHAISTIKEKIKYSEEEEMEDESPPIESMHLKRMLLLVQKIKDAKNGC